MRRSRPATRDFMAAASPLAGDAAWPHKPLAEDRASSTTFGTDLFTKPPPHLLYLKSRGSEDLRQARPFALAILRNRTALAEVSVFSGAHVERRTSINMDLVGASAPAPGKMTPLPWIGPG